MNLDPETVPVNLADLVQPLTGDTLRSVTLFSPELAVCGTIVVMLLARILLGPRWGAAPLVAALGSVLGLVCATNPDAAVQVALFPWNWPLWMVASVATAVVVLLLAARRAAPAAIAAVLVLGVLIAIYLGVGGFAGLRAVMRSAPATSTPVASQSSSAGVAVPAAPSTRPLERREEIFTGMLVVDGFTRFFRVLLLGFALLFILFTQLSGIPDTEDAADFYSLVLGATLGMMLMSSANHLMMVFLAVEMASVPSYCLAGMLKGRREASEAALKYAVYGAGTAGVMLYGISLLGGVLGSIHLPTIAARLAHALHSGLPPAEITVLSLAGLMVMVGLAFKLSAVPFHFWCPDVFEGASAEVNAFLSVASKAAALALLIRVVVGFGLVSEPAAGATAAGAERTTAMLAVPDDASIPGPGTAPGRAAAQVAQASGAAPVEGGSAALAPARRFMAQLIAFLAAITCTFGNLAAYGQSNMKRLLAYSTIAHAGYMMMPVAAGIALLDSNPTGAANAFGSVAFYLSVYLFMNLGAFAIVAFLRNAMRSEEIADYAGLIRRCPGVVICLAAILFSLIGLPPLAGFPAKFAAFAALANAGMWILFIIAAVNTAISLYYYLRVIKVMVMDKEPESRLPVDLPLASLPGLYVAAVTLPVVVLIGNWSILIEPAQAAARQLLQLP